MQCPHLIKSKYKPELVVKKVSSNCTKCEATRDSLWSCCTCGQVGCGRFEYGHAKLHYEETKHPVALDLDSKAFHCYICDDYISSTIVDLDTLREKVTTQLAGPSLVSNKIPSLTGLKNLGNTCYINVILQVLFASHVTVKSKSPLFIAFQELQKQVKTCQEPAIAPNDFIQVLFKQLSFPRYQQQDAQELFLYLLDAFGESIQSLFKGSFIKIITCQKCRSVFEKTEPFVDLPLTIHDTLIDAMNDFFKKEVLQDENAYLCSKCGPSKATLVTNWMEHPKLLCCTLKRFKYHRSRSKVNQFISFPKVYNNMYQLYAVVVHHGSAVSGHYICYVYSSQWYEMNDSFVAPVSESVVFESPAYMLFYQKVKNKALG